jgi:hypothetical protein
MRELLVKRFDRNLFSEPSSRMLVLAVAIGSWSARAGAQEPPRQSSAPSATAPAPPARSEPTQETLKKLETHHEELARLLETDRYGPAFGLGAQADFLAPAAGVSALVLGYDAVFVQVDTSIGVGIGGDPVNDKGAASTYAFDVRVALPVHRGVRADFSIVAGGGATLVDPPAGGWYAVGLGIAGGRIRLFEGPNVALAGSLGLAGLFRGEHSLVILGAKPLGSASIVYFFR